MKTKMKVKATENESKAIITISTVYKGFDKMKEFGEIKKAFADSETIGMIWNEKTGEYETVIDLTPENAQPFVQYAQSHELEIIM